MTEQNLVAIYDTAAHADEAVQALKAVNVPASAISRHAPETGGAPGKGIWSSLFGGESADTDILDRSIAAGSTVITVKVPEEHVARVSEILEAYGPADVDERAIGYGAEPAADFRSGAAPVVTDPARMPAAGTDDTIKVVEERLVIGKRAVNRGGARVRSYVVETPVEQQITLRDETVRIERRPVAGGHAASRADFQDRVIEMSEVDEEAVVGKQAHVVEEISLRKEVVDRVETVRDTVRRTEVDIEGASGAKGAARAGSPAGNGPLDTVNSDVPTRK